MKVRVTVDEVILDHEDFYTKHTGPGVIVSCDRCGHHVEVFGTSEGSIKRGCVMLKESCPRAERNFYEEK